MEVKDTIEKAIKEARGKRPGIIIPRDDIYRAIFKAGRDSFLDDVGNATIPLSEAYKKGMRKVVEWMLEGGLDNWVRDDNLKDKLKEWGIDGD